MSNHRSLLVFVKNPVKGKVKTRLAASLGDQEAMDIYLQLMACTRKTVERVEARKILYYCDFIDKEDEWSNQVFTKKKQAEGGLGHRMSIALKQELATSDKACLVGSDIPELTETLIMQAFDRLNQFDVVLGPALDGGYYLVGVKDDHQYLFENIAWSTDQVLAQTIDIAIRNALSVHLLSPLSDVDLAEDWLKVAESVRERLRLIIT